MINKELDNALENKLDYKYELKYKSISRSNMNDVIEVQQRGLKLGFFPAILGGVLMYSSKFRMRNCVLGFFGIQYLIFSLYSYRTFQIYEALSYKMNSKLNEEINLMMDLI